MYKKDYAIKFHNLRTACYGLLFFETEQGAYDFIEYLNEYGEDDEFLYEGVKDYIENIQRRVTVKELEEELNIVIIDEYIELFM